MGRNKKLVKDSVGSPAEAVDSAHGVIEELMTEMQEWRDNMEGAGTGLENTEKFQTVSDAADALESGENSLQEAVSAVEDIACDREVAYSYLKPYGRKPMSRYDRLGEAVSLLESAADVLEGFAVDKRSEVEEANEEANEAAKAKDAAAEKEATEKAEKAEEAAQAADDAAGEIREALDECGDVEVPGMFG